MDINLGDQSASEEQSINRDQIVSMIARMPEFHYFSKSEVAQLADSDLQTFQRGETLLSAGGMESRMILLLLAGKCSIEKPITVNGKEEVVCIERIHAPAVLGEVGVFSSQPRTANVVSESRSLGLLLPVKALLRRFELSKATYPQMLWSFAKLGVLRISSSASKYASLMNTLVECDILEAREFADEAMELEKIIGSKPGKSAITHNEFDMIRELVERLDTALAFACHFEQIFDNKMPSNDSMAKSFSGSLSVLAIEALLNNENQNKNIKQAVVETCANQKSLCQGTGDWAICLEGMIEATGDLADLSRLIKENQTQRREAPGAKAMIDGFACRIDKELKRVESETVKRFGLENLPARLDDSDESSIMENYMLNRIRKINARVLISDFEPDILSEYYKAGKITRNQVAMEFYKQLEDNPVLNLISAKFQGSPPEDKLEMKNDEFTLLEFFQLGHALIYPKLLYDKQYDWLRM